MASVKEEEASKARAVRCPVPVTISTSAFPRAQPGRLTTSRITAASSGMR